MGYLWLDKPYEVMVYLILDIAGLLRKGLDPATYLHNDCENINTIGMKTKYQLIDGGKGFLIKSIVNDAV